MDSQTPSGDAGTASHWNDVYSGRTDDQLSWFEAEPSISLRMIAEATSGPPASVVDVGGGSSALVDRLLDAGYGPLAVLDVSREALARAKSRLGDRSAAVTWIEDDVTAVESIEEFDVWHDRVLFHFLLGPNDRRRYVRLAERTVRAGGHLVLATFSPAGPEYCSGLPVRRYDAASLARELGAGFELEDSREVVHVTPNGVEQALTYARLRRA